MGSWDREELNYLVRRWDTPEKDRSKKLFLDMAQCFWDGVELFGTTLGYTGEGPIEENKNKVAKKSRSGEK